MSDTIVGAHDVQVISTSWCFESLFTLDVAAMDVLQHSCDKLCRVTLHIQIKSRVCIVKFIELDSETVDIDISVPSSLVTRKLNEFLDKHEKKRTYLKLRDETMFSILRVEGYVFELEQSRSQRV